MTWGFGEVLWFRRATGTLADRLRARAAAQTRTFQAWLAGRHRTLHHRLEWMVKSGGIEVVRAGVRDGSIRFPWPEG